MMKGLTILALGMLLSAPGSACDIDGRTGFLPENDLKIPVNSLEANDMTEERFNAIIDKAETHYAPIVEKLGGTLDIQRLWSNNTVNASAQRMGSTYRVNMYGGLARHQETTADGFALVICHELGHHLGGAPKVRSFFNRWASNEGQSDYFGSMKCFRRIFESEDNVKIVSEMEVDEFAKNKCEEQYSNEGEVALCIRSAMAGMSLARLLGSLRGNTDVKFETPDTNVVSQTNDRHPAAQCRLDTYFSGTLCDKDHNTPVSNRDANTGVCNRDAGDEIGTRPLCWYKP